MSDIKLGTHRGQFVAVWRDAGGHRQRRSLGTDDRKLALIRLSALKANLSARVPAGPLTVGTIYAAYISDREEDGKCVARIKDAWKRMSTTFEYMRPSDITKADCNAYIVKRRKDGVSDGTTWTELGYLRCALAFAVKKQWITSAPFIKLPQKPGPREHHLTRDEAKRLLDAAATHHVQLFIRLALATAGRASTLLELTWVRVDLDARRIYLRDPERGVTNKGRATVPINDSLLLALTEARRASVSPFVIEWAGSRVQSVKKAVGAAAARAGVKCTPHVLRHTAAVWMAEAGVPMEQIAQYLGHRTSKITASTYARFSPDFQREAAAALEI
jgi:integrase